MNKASSWNADFLSAYKNKSLCDQLASLKAINKINSNIRYDIPREKIDLTDVYRIMGRNMNFQERAKLWILR